MPTAKPRLQITLRMPTYLLLSRLAKLRGTSRANIVSEFVEEIAPVLQRVERVMQRAREAQDWPKQWRAEAEALQRQLEESSRLNLDLFEGLGAGSAPRSGASPTPEPVTRGSGGGKPLIHRKPTRKRSA